MVALFTKYLYCKNAGHTLRGYEPKQHSDNIVPNNINDISYQLSALLAGFGFTSSLVLLIAYLFFLSNMRKTAASKLACCAVLLGLAGLQYCHFLYFTIDYALLSSRVYASVLVVLPPSFFFFTMFAVMALIALILGLALPYLDARIFFLSYSNAISIALMLVIAALLIFPELLNDIMLITELAYAKSKLTGVDTPTKIAELNDLMNIDKHYENENLNLATVAGILDLSSHQLSELINTHHQCSFPQFVRQHRIEAAKKLLRAETNASVLSISMMTGFKSQSSFYTAFKELTGESPASFRKQEN